MGADAGVAGAGDGADAGAVLGADVVGGSGSVVGAGDLVEVGEGIVGAVVAGVAVDGLGGIGTTFADEVEGIMGIAVEVGTDGAGVGGGAGDGVEVEEGVGDLADAAGDGGVGPFVGMAGFVSVVSVGSVVGVDVTFSHQAYLRETCMNYWSSASGWARMSASSSESWSNRTFQVTLWGSTKERTVETFS